MQHSRVERTNHLAVERQAFFLFSQSCIILGSQELLRIVEVCAFYFCDVFCPFSFLEVGNILYLEGSFNTVQIPGVVFMPLLAIFAIALVCIGSICVMGFICRSVVKRNKELQVQIDALQDQRDEWIDRCAELMKKINKHTKSIIDKELTQHISEVMLEVSKHKEETENDGRFMDLDLC
jgi:hypothetical protein